MDNEFNLLLENCKEKFNKLIDVNDKLYGYKYWFLFTQVLCIQIYIDPIEARIGRCISINNMKKYLGVWIRKT